MENVKFDYKTIEKMSKLLSIASDETRLTILCALLGGRKNVSELVEISECSQSLISHQLSVLKKAKLVTSTKEGNFVYYELDDEHVYELIKVSLDHVKHG